ncbi:hypothetical protein EDD18DRAFT_1164371 [Armillaria luteobubalina]|uniref:Uncharacterized protein n=1 Tax=Armillaria luteobubalina TaxID=153913 RepID=A0AA39Q8G7_9AGAR|nr:hypothetical protein EDD18DRAFT_1164371 [Armillaria luteobubalina]
MSQETASRSPSRAASPSPALQPEQKRGRTRSNYIDESDNESDTGAPRRRSQRQGSGRLPLGGEDTTRAVSGGVANVGGGGGRSGGQKDTLKLRLDLNLDVDISIKARVHGDVTLSLLHEFLKLITRD